MAPLSYYWLISFIYLVMVKFEIFALLVINLNNRIVTLRDNSTPVYDFFSGNPDCDRTFAVPHLSRQKKDMYIWFNQVL
jgi:hypothetical protein